MNNFDTWIVTNGAAGFETQALGIAEAMGVTPAIKRVMPSAPWRWLAPWGPAMRAEEFVPPWPDLVIAGGRQSIPFARMIRRASRGSTFVAILQDPRVPPSWFDFVWAPAHDRLSGRNVFTTLASPHRITPQRLDGEARRIAPEIAHLPRPRLAVLLGGTTDAFRFDQAAAARFGDQLADLSRRYGASLMITPSRRSGKAEVDIIRERTKGVPAMIWSGESPNPYFGYLGSADAVIVTCDSVNMVGEAAGTGKPVYIVELAGGTARSRRFLDAVYAHGAARPFNGELASWSYEPLDATAEIANAIVRAMNERGIRPR